MKKEKKIFDGITNVNDDLIEEAKNERLSKVNSNKSNPSKKKNKWQKWTFLAASIVVLAGIGLFLFGNKEGKSIIQPIVPVIYPKAYAFDDYDAKFQIREENPIDDNFISTMNEFAYKTSSLILTQETKNTNYSPLSLYYALSLAASGAEGETKSEFLDLLGVMDTQFLSSQLGNLYRLLYFENEIGQLKIANSIWMDNDFHGEPIEFKEDFVNNAVNNYYASSHSADFSYKDTAKAMADWIFTNTNGTLSPTFEISDDQILSIINTIYFYDQWTDRFQKSKTAKDTFYPSDEGEVKVDYMNMTNESHSFLKGENFTRSDLGLKNAGRMFFVLPDKGVSPYDLIDSPDKIKEVFEGGIDSVGEVVWKIPKFNFSSKLELKETLKSLGVTTAFSNDANFDGITDHFANISNVLQETHISIDEKGVEASAFTKIDYDGSALPHDKAYMILDRPFIYGITSNNGALLFVGVCENPGE